jgi:hypothetical protein
MQPRSSWLDVVARQYLAATGSCRSSGCPHGQVAEALAGSCGATWRWSSRVTEPGMVIAALRGES